MKLKNLKIITSKGEPNRFWTAECDGPAGKVKRVSSENYQLVLVSDPPALGNANEVDLHASKVAWTKIKQALKGKPFKSAEAGFRVLEGLIQKLRFSDLEQD